MAVGAGPVGKVWGGGGGGGGGAEAVTCCLLSFIHSEQRSEAGMDGGAAGAGKKSAGKV